MPSLEFSPLAPAVLNKSGWLLPPEMSTRGQRDPEQHVKPVPTEARILSSLPRGDNTAAGLALVRSQWSMSHTFSPVYNMRVGGRWFNVSLVPVSLYEG